MSKYMGPKIKVLKRLGTILPGLVGINFNSKKIRKRNKDLFSKKTKLSEYNTKLIEKQKIKFYYCLTNNQLNNYVKKVSLSKSGSSFLLLILLEKRLDNVVFRSGFASTILQSRQILNHGHLLVNGKRVNIPSYCLKIGDIITVSEKSKMKSFILKNREQIAYKLPSYLINLNNESIKFISNPIKTDILVSFNEQLVIEYYH